MRFVFGDHLLDVDRRELRCRGERVALEPQVFDLLRYLIEHRERVVSKGDLVSHIWRGRIVSDSTLTSRLNAARTAVGDSGATQQVIRTIARKGVRFVAEVVVEGDPTIAVAPSALALPDKPSIAVLPFDNMSGDPAQDYFADGMVEEITTALSHIGWLFVIARNSSFVYKGKATDVRRVGRELGVRYVLEGSIRKDGNRVRITAQLIEAENATHLWADRFDGSLEDVFDLQDQVATSVAGIIEPALIAAETHRAVRRPTHDLTAYDLYLRAQPLYFSFSRDGITGALRLFEQAIERDPSYGAALGMASMCHERFRQDGWSSDPEHDRRRGIELARSALQASPGDPGVLANAGFVLGFSEDDIGGVIAVMDRALELNPSYARGWYLSAVICNLAGLADEAVGRAKRAIRLSPRERSGPFLIPIGFAHFLSRDFESAIEVFGRIIQEYPNFPETYRILAACYAHVGRLDDARITIDRLQAKTSAILPPYVSSMRCPEQRELYLSGLRLAMGESGQAVA